MNDNEIHCARCGRIAELSEVDSDGLTTSCPNCEDKVLMSPADVRQALNKAESEANNHGSNYAAGMRLARHLIEKELLSEVRSDDPRE